MNVDLAALGIDIDLADGDMVLDAVVLLRVANGDRPTGLVLETTPGMDWMMQIGMVEAARDILRGPVPDER